MAEDGQQRPRRKHRRALSAEELALWESVAEQVQPLAKPDIAAPEIALDPVRPDPPPAQRPRTKAAAPAGAKAVPRPAPAPRHQGIDRRTLQGLRRGRTPIDARLDLHGHRQATAHAALAAFLQGAARAGRRFVLVITGKGAPPGAGGRDGDGDLPIPERRGILRSAVPLWLREPGLADLVVGVAAAGPLHGGSGALYIQLRRKGLGSFAAGTRKPAG